MEQYTLTGITWFWLFVPMPILIIWAIWTYFSEGKGEG